VSPPSVGVPPRDLRAGDPASAALLKRGGARFRARAFDAALDLDPTLHDRYPDTDREALHSDLEAFVDRLAVAVASGDAHVMATFADLVAVRYRKRKAPSAQLITPPQGARAQ